MNTIQQLKTEYLRRAVLHSLLVQCPMDGDFNAELAFVAQGPGKREAETKQPLIGESGSLLWGIVSKKYGWNRRNVYLSNVVKRLVQVPIKSSFIKAVGKGEMQDWQNMLRWELLQLPNLKYVVCLGEPALTALTGLRGINNWRGSVLERTIRQDGAERDVLIIVANNPAAVIRDPSIEVTLRFDMGKTYRAVSGKYKKYDIKYHYDPTADEALHWIDKIHKEAAIDYEHEPMLKTAVSFDIETPGNETGCIGLAVNGHEGYCINFRTFDKNRFTVTEEVAIRRRLQRLFADKRVRFVAQNGNFDAYWMYFKDRIQVHRVWFDTLLAHHTLYPLLPHSLQYLTAQYTDHPFYKDEANSWREGGDIEQYWEYNIKDVCVTWTAHVPLYKALRSAGMLDFFFNHVMYAQQHLTHMTVMGVPTDVALKKHISEELNKEVDDMESAIQDKIEDLTDIPGNRPNVRSYKQMRTVYFQQLRLVGRGTSTNKDNRRRMIENPRTVPAVRQLLIDINTFAEESKFLGTYANSLLDADGRTRTEYKQFGTQRAPGRLSSSGVLWGTGTNLQNQPHRAYPVYHAPEGYTLVYFDLAQAEARFVAWDARIQSWIEQFEKARLEGGYDCHRALASIMFKVPYEDVPKEDFIDNKPTIRYKAKRCRHGLNYRMGAFRLAETTGMMLAEAEINYHIYHQVTPELRVWWAQLELEVRRNRMLINPYGRRIVFMEKLTNESLESIVAFRPQSSIGDKVVRVIYQAQEDDEWPLHARVLLNIHDALVAIARPKDAKTVLRILKRHAEEPIIIHNEPMIIPADCKQAVNATSWRVDDDSQVKFYNDEGGKYRWSDLETVEIAA